MTRRPERGIAPRKLFDLPLLRPRGWGMKISGMVLLGACFGLALACSGEADESLTSSEPLLVAPIKPLCDDAILAARESCQGMHPDKKECLACAQSAVVTDKRGLQCLTNA